MLNDRELEGKKRFQRAQAIRAREGLSPELRRTYSEIVCQKLQNHPAILNASVVMSYMAFGAELDLALFHDALRKRETAVCFPVTFGSGYMDAYAPDGADAWVVDAYGIQSPNVECAQLIDPASIDIVVVPCVAFDMNGWRIGWGGGYYDRFLPRCARAHTIGVGFEVQRTDLLVINPDWDIKLDEIVTEHSL